MTFHDNFPQTLQLLEPVVLRPLPPRPRPRLAVRAGGEAGRGRAAGAHQARGGGGGGAGGGQGYVPVVPDDHRALALRRLEVGVVGVEVGAGLARVVREVSRPAQDTCYLRTLDTDNIIMQLYVR